MNRNVTRRPPSAGDLHREWLELVDTDGPFLAVPALTRVYGSGIPQPDADTVAVLKDAKPAFEKAWEAWDRARDAPLDLLLGGLAPPQPEREVVADGHLGVERVVLEDHRDVAVARRDGVDDVLTDQDPPVGDRLEAREHPQGGRLARARRADQHHELAVGDVQVQLADGLDRSEALDHAVEGDSRHQPVIPSPLP